MLICLRIHSLSHQHVQCESKNEKEKYGPTMNFGENMLARRWMKQHWCEYVKKFPVVHEYMYCLLPHFQIAPFIEFLKDGGPFFA